MSIRLVSDRITPSLRRLEKQLVNLPRLMHQEWLRNTPVASGNAKRQTTLNDKTITARYDYAQRLDRGYSKQNPRGMSEPVREFIQRYLNQVLRKT